MTVTESNDGSVQMTIQNLGHTNKIICDLDMADGINIIDKLEDYCKGLQHLIQVFSSQESVTRRDKFGNKA